jgi:uncharacterized membrane protein
MEGQDNRVLEYAAHPIYTPIHPPLSPVVVALAVLSGIGLAADLLLMAFPSIGDSTNSTECISFFVLYGPGWLAAVTGLLSILFFGRKRPAHLKLGLLFVSAVLANILIGIMSTAMG